MLSRRGFLLAMVAQAVAGESPRQQVVITVRHEDMPRFRDTDALRELLWQDEQDMDIHKQLGVNLARIKREDRLYAKIQADRKW